MSPPIGPANRQCGDPCYGYAGAGARGLAVSGRRYGAEFPQGDRGEFSNGRYGLALRRSVPSRGVVRRVSGRRRLPVRSAIDASARRSCSGCALVPYESRGVRDRASTGARCDGADWFFWACTLRGSRRAVLARGRDRLYYSLSGSARRSRWDEVAGERAGYRCGARSSAQCGRRSGTGHAR